MGFLGGLFGAETGGEKDLRKFTNAGFDDPRKQKYMPGYLQSGSVSPFLSKGIAGIGELMRNPGGLNPNISQAIAPRLAMESEGINRSFAGLQANQAGGAARSNLPVSIKNALASALGMGQERAQRDARRGAMLDSESLRRGDLDNTYKLLEQILGFANSGMGMAQQGLGQSAQNDVARQAAMQQMIGSLASSASTMGASSLMPKMGASSPMPKGR